MKTIQVEDQTWETLMLRKIQGKFSSIDELINSILKGEAHGN